MSAEPSDAILSFYRGGQDAEGRTLDEILAWDDEQFEDVHDYVQWLFPTSKASAFNRNAPVLGQAAISAFRAEPVLRARLGAALSRMLHFYGFQLAERDGLATVARGPNWTARREEWLAPGNHNLLRITRILDSLSTLGLADHGRAFLAALDALDDRDRHEIGRRTYEFWRNAVH